MQDVEVKSAATTPSRRKVHWGRWLTVGLVVLLAGGAWLARGTGLWSWIKNQIIPSSAPGAKTSVKDWTDRSPQVLREGDWDPKIHFDKIALPAADGLPDGMGAGYTAVKVGPDGRLYAASVDGRIFRFPIRDDGTLAVPTVIDSIPKAEGGKRLLIGLCFDPKSTADNLLLWTTHSDGPRDDAADWTGKVTLLRGPNLETVEDVIVGLPRSLHDHATNQPEFGPDGALYIPQGSTTACGAPDDYWGKRPEHVLSATILRLDVKRVTPGKPIDVRTPEGGGDYDPYARHAPLTIYATGLRNAFSLVWHRNGRLYVPVNGAGVHGITPRGNDVESYDIAESEHDWLFRITEGKYYGHPNPRQNHYVMNGGHPDQKDKSYYVKEYPLGTQPDQDYEPPILDFGSHCSADGIIEYRGKAFGGRLDGKLMVCRYNMGQDILCIGLDADGDVASVTTGEGISKNELETPLALTEDLHNGNLYVTEYAAKRIVLLKPGVPSPGASSRPATRPSSGEGSRTANPAGHPAND